MEKILMIIKDYVSAKERLNFKKKYWLFRGK